MPPKGGKTYAGKRNEDTQRLLGDARVTAPATTAGTLDRRPHHLVSRLHPPWNAPAGPGTTSGGGSTSDNNGGHHPPLHAGGAGATAGRNAGASATASNKPAVTARGRAALPTRLAGRIAGAPQEERKNCVASSNTARGTAVGKRNAVPITAGQKRSRSPSASNPIKVDAKDSVEEKGEDAAESNTKDVLAGTSSQTSSISPSPLPMVAESKVWHGGVGDGSSSGGSNSAAQMKSATEHQQTSSAETHATFDPARVTATTMTTTPNSTVLTANIESNSVSPQKLPPQNPTASVAASKMAFRDTVDDGGDIDDGVVWSSQGAAATQNAAEPDSISPLPHRMPETHVLGELPDRASVTPARPTRAAAMAAIHAPSEKEAPQQMRAFVTEEAEEDEESELLGELFNSNDVAAHAAYRETNLSKRIQQIIGEETENQIASTGPATPSLLPSHEGVSPVQCDRSPGTGVGVMAANMAAVRLAETLAVQDLSLLPEESGNPTTQGEVFSILPSSSPELHTPRRVPRTDLAHNHHSATGEDEEAKQRDAKELVLGEGLVSPPVKRATATPQQAAQETAAAITAGTASTAVGNSETRKNKNNAVQRELHPPPPLPDGLSASSTSDSSLASHTPPRVAAAPRAHGETDAEASPPPPISSLPSTLDDGCWKEDEQTPLRTPPSTFAVAQRHDTADFSGPLAKAAAAAAKDAPSALQDTVPIDPFLHTPPQFRQQGAARRTAVLRKGSEATSEPVIATVTSTSAVAANSKTNNSSGRNRSPPRRAVGRGNGRRSASTSPSPPRTDGTKQHASMDADRTRGSNNTHTNACNGADVDPAVLRVGTRVEGRWGRQWFPAVVSETPRNGFVQIEWVEDASLLHVRLREVRLPPGASVAVTAGAAGATASAKEEEGSTKTADKRGVSSLPSEGPVNEGGAAVLTATQLVELMEEEDAEDSRGEVKHRSTTRASTVAAAEKGKKPMTTLVRRSADRRDGEEKQAEIREEEEEDVLSNEPTLRTRPPRKGSTTPLTTSSAVPSSPQIPPPPLSTRDERTTPTVTIAAGLNLVQQEKLALPSETAPSALCIYLAPSVRRELLNGTCNPTGGSATGTEVQRNTELQRILHFLTSAGATLISSLAQADNVAAEMCDSASAATLLQRPPTTTAERSSSSLSSLGDGGSSITAAGRRKTVGRVPLPRKSGFTSTSAAKKFFIFLVSTPSSPSSALDSDVGARVPLYHLPDVCVAHAFGVSAIHASWLWSVVPGALHVKLPTAKYQLELSRDSLHFSTEDSVMGNASPTGETATALPLRLMPFPSNQRWLSGTSVQFVERDDEMEMWLNAAGAVVTAEPPPPPPPTAALFPHPVTSETENISAVSAGDPLPAVAAAAAHRLSASVTRKQQQRQQQQSPPRKQSCEEKLPDLVYVRESGVTVPVDLKRLGDIPVLRLPWLVSGIEYNYRARCCRVSGEEVEKRNEGTESPPLLASVWEGMQKAMQAAAAAAARSQSRKRRSTTPPEKDGTMESPSVSYGVEAQAAHADARTWTVMDSVAGAPMAESTVTAASSGAPQPADQRMNDSLTAEGNAKQVDMRSPDPKRPPLHESGRTAKNAQARAAATLLLGRPTATAAEDAQKTAHDRGGGDGVQSTEEGKGKPEGKASIKLGDANDEVDPAASSLCSATPHQPLQPPVCAHPPIAVGEDYYFSIGVPSASTINVGPTQLAAMPATTVALGRVVAIAPNRQRGDSAAGSLSAVSRDDTASGTSACCLVDLQLYKAKYVSMHVDPRSGEVVHQTTLYLSPQHTIVPPSSLLFGIPVYVITAAARQHVYLLEEEDGEDAPPVGLPFRPTGTQQRPTHGGRTDTSCAATFPLSPRPNHSATVSASPAPNSPFPRRGAKQQFREGHDKVNTKGEIDTTTQQGSLNATDRLHIYPSHGGAVSLTSATGEPPEQGSPSDQANSIPSESVHGTTIDDHGAASSSVPRPVQVVELEGRLPYAAVVSRHAVQGNRGPSSQGRIALGNAVPSARVLSQLPVEIEGRTVLLRPSSQIFFYPRRSLSLSERSPSMPTHRSSQAQRADSPSRAPPASDEADVHQRKRRKIDASANPAVHRTADRDSSEELIAEAPLAGQVELMREMDGMVDVVVHTSQPNSVFGGSKMYRVTPDMIVDVSP
ncbi:hypothetical protein ABB37_02847 [Leptomonas pyrrhocoris]|uniref:Uncharacterized protein n=1 Tax=Leptomonas pyrrhocoris TaxID=157538 RepID=A0A0N0DXN2_LEPPY|nr:hypothetical protein ABB37_02847 [Leptomonas pyrrhocoris]KPA83151.1 hypothetical protein ABB37_02847 [Leptomonas pyrrhocoris]|eukprot:XP_015661590.1 hypothetical protein ABB37_02847 [Leptomonas pyrrhocoris]